MNVFGILNKVLKANFEYICDRKNVKLDTENHFT